MNCRQVQSLISPYLDQQLSGQEMLEMSAHLQRCPSCAAECRDVQQVRLVLRALPPKIPRQTLEARLVMDAERSSWFFPTEVRLPRRGRHFARALALSGLGLLTFSAPFAPAAFDGGRLPSMRSMSHASAPVPGTVFVVDMGGAATPDLMTVRLSPVPSSLAVSAVLRPESAHMVGSAYQSVQMHSLPLSVWGGADPRQMPQTGSDLSLAGYHSR